MNRLKTFLLITALTVMASFWGAAGPDTASATTLLFEYSAFGSGTSTASGYITFSNILPNPGSVSYSRALGTFGAVLDLSITVDDGHGNKKTFTEADYKKFVWDTGGGTLDMSWPTNMIGQFVTYMYNGEEFGYSFGTLDSSGGYGDFSLYANTANNGPNSAPDFYDFFMLEYNGDLMFLTSLVATPEPATLLLLCVGLAGFALFRMRRTNGEGGCLAA